MDGACSTFVADCPLRLGTDLLAHRWDPVVLVALRTGARRRADLATGIGGISDKVLSDALRRLCANGLVVRRATPSAARYELSVAGASLAEGPLVALAGWAVEHGEEVLDAQARAAAAG